MQANKESVQKENEMKPDIMMKTKIKKGLMTRMVAWIRRGFLIEMIEEDKIRERHLGPQSLIVGNLRDGQITQEKIHLSE